MVNPTYVRTHACMHAGTPHIPPPTRMHAHAHAHANTRTHALMHTRAPFLWQYAYTPPKHSYSSHFKRTFLLILCAFHTIHPNPTQLLAPPYLPFVLTTSPPKEKKQNNKTKKQDNKSQKKNRRRDKGFIYLEGVKSDFRGVLSHESKSTEHPGKLGTMHRVPCTIPAHFWAFLPPTPRPQGLIKHLGGTQDT